MSMDLYSLWRTGPGGGPFSGQDPVQTKHGSRGTLEQGTKPPVAQRVLL